MQNINSRNPLPISALTQYNPNIAGSLESIWQPQYDFQAYATGGATSMNFFSIPQGQSSKTYADTNLLLAGQFPSPCGFLITAIMVVFIPNSAGNPSSTGTALAANSNINDVVRVANSGYLQLVIGSKPYLYDAPLGKFPPNFSVSGLQSVAIATTAATTTNQLTVDYARSNGRYYEITPLLIPMNQNFSISLNWPTAVTVANTGRIGVIMDGFYYRQSQ